MEEVDTFFLNVVEWWWCGDNFHLCVESSSTLSITFSSLRSSSTFINIYNITTKALTFSLHWLINYIKHKSYSKNIKISIYLLRYFWVHHTLKLVYFKVRTFLTFLLLTHNYIIFKNILGCYGDIFIFDDINNNINIIKYHECLENNRDMLNYKTVSFLIACSSHILTFLIY